MPTGGAAKMQSGKNLLYFSKKEQCLALGRQLRTFFKINNYKVYRILRGGLQTRYLHPKFGVFPEKLDASRERVGNLDRSIGKNPEPVGVKFSRRTTFD
jgi:photosystem I subunit 2